MKKTIKKLIPQQVKEERARLRKMQDDITAIRENVFHRDRRLDDLKQYLKEVEAYQPTYGLTGIIDKPQRDSKDRCQVIEAHLGRAARLKLLDIGSSLGYIPFYFADRGASTEGWEYNPKNAEVARLIGQINGVEATFKTKEFNLDSVNALQDNEFDVVTILSVMHHVTFYKGLDYSKKLMKALLEKCPIVIVELAKKGEDKKLEWDASQPKDELEIFNLVKDEVTIKKIGEFSNHLSKNKRPLYVVSRKKTLKVNSKNYTYLEKSSEAYNNSPIAGAAMRRFYYFGEGFVAKEYQFGKEVGINKKQIIAELNTLLNTENVPSLPKLIDYELNEKNARVVIQKVKGQLLDELIGRSDNLPVDKIMKDVLSALVELEGEGLCHNDVRSWNVIYDGKKATLIDYGFVSHKQQDNDLIALLWVVNAVVTGERESYDIAKTELPPAKNFETTKSKKAYEKIKTGEKSPAAILKELK